MRLNGWGPRTVFFFFCFFYFVPAGAPSPPSAPLTPADILLESAPPLQELIDPDVELVEPDEEELRARQPVVMDLAASASKGGRASGGAAAGVGESDEDGESLPGSDDIIDLT